MALSLEEQAFADRTIAAHARAARARCSASWNASRNTIRTNICRRDPGIRRGQDRYPARADLQRGHVLRAVQPGAAGRAHHLHLPRHRLPHARLAQPAASACASNSGLPEDERGRRRQALRHHAGPASSPLRTVACFGQCALAPGGGGGSRDLRPHERADAAPRSRSASRRRGRQVTRIQDIGTFNAVREAGHGEAAAVRGRASPSAWAPAARATAPRASTTPSPKPSTSAGCDVQLARVGCFGFCAQEPLVNVWLPGQPLVILRRVQASDVGRILDDLAAGQRPGRPRALQDRGVGPPHRPRQIRHRLSRNPALERGSVLQARRRRSCCATAA